MTKGSLFGPSAWPGDWAHPHGRLPPIIWSRAAHGIVEGSWAGTCPSSFSGGEYGLPMSDYEGKLAELGAVVPRLNLGKTVRRLRDGRPLRGKRDEINALAAIFIEETWLRVEKWIQTLTFGLPLKKKASGKVLFERVPAGALLTKAD